MRKIALLNIYILVLAAGICSFRHSTAGMQSIQPGTQDTARVQYMLAEAKKFLSQSDYDSSDFYAQKALDLSRRIFFRPGKAYSQFVLGESAFKRNDQLIAIRYYFGALREYEMTGDSLAMALTGVRIGKIYNRAGLYGKAVEYMLTALRIYSGRGIPEETEELLLELANSYFLLQDYLQSASYYSQLLIKYQSEKKPDQEVFVIDRLIQCYSISGMYDRSLEFSFQLLDRYRSTGNRSQEAVVLNNIGYAYKYLGQFDESNRYFNESIAVGKSIGAGKEQNPVTMVNLAILQQNLGEYKSAIGILQEAIQILEGAGDQAELGQTFHLLSNIYFQEKDYYNARVYNLKAMEIAESRHDQELLARTCLLASRIDESLYEYERSFDYYKKYLDIRDSIARSGKEQQEALLQQQYLVERAEKEIAMLLGDQEIKDMELIQLRLEAETREQQLQIFQKNDSLQKITIKNQELERNRAMQDLLLAEERLATEQKNREIEALKQKEAIQVLELREKELEQQRSQQEIELLTKDKALNALALSKMRSRNYFMVGLSLLTLAVLYAVYRGLRFARRANRKLARQNVEIRQQKEEINQNLILIEEERRKSDSLLLNILPASTANELKERGEALPRHYERVTILFTDFVGFTFVAERMSPQELIAELNHCFFEFDKIIERHGIEKIKTIGDAYMCAGGIPVANTTNPFDVVSAALEIRDFVTHTRQERLAAGKDYWEVRIGVNTGPVMAGVVGKNKFAYDIWGDAVNIAARLESSGKSGKVNISENTYLLIKEKFECSYRGKVLAKNKGEIDMYFVEKIKD
jgi:class 3 adenylate cyclase